MAYALNKETNGETNVETNVLYILIKTKLDSENNESNASVEALPSQV